MTTPTRTSARGSFAALYSAAFVAQFDRGVLPPLLIAIGVALGQPVDAIAISLTVYAIAYAAFQLLWGALSDRIGRVRVLVISTAIGAVGAVVAALATEPWLLAVGRGLAGAGFAATMPSALTYFGDTLGQEGRLRANANLNTVSSIGMIVGTFGAALLTQFVGWRSAFVVIAVAGGVVSLLLTRMPEPKVEHRTGFLRSIALLARAPWAILVLVLVFIEGWAMFGAFSYLPTAVQHGGGGLVLAGAVTAVYGVSVIVFGQLVRLFAGRARPWALILGGGICGTAGFLLVGLSFEVWSAVAAAILIGISWAVAHTALQTWIADAVWMARPIGMAFFSMFLFTGGSLGAASIAFVPGGAGGDGLGVLFIVATAVMAVFTLTGAIGRRLYRAQAPQ